MDLNLEGKSVVITGGSRGIGLASAALFAQEGCDVHIVGKSAKNLDAAADRLANNHPGKITTHCADLADADGVSQIAGLLASVDVVVNNAGAIPGGDLEHVDDTRWREAWELKVFGYINACRIALPSMVQRGHGVIVNVIGMAGAAPRYDYVCGSMANAALIAFTRSAGSYAAKHGARVVGVNPGPTETSRIQDLYRKRAQAALGDADRWKEMLTGLPFGRPALPEEMADLIGFLASTRASYLSGTVIDADGGAQYGSS